MASLTKKEIVTEMDAAKEAMKHCEYGIAVNRIVLKAFEDALILINKRDKV